MCRSGGLLPIFVILMAIAGPCSNSPVAPSFHADARSKLYLKSISEPIFYHLSNVVVDWSNPLLHQRAGWIAVTVVCQDVIPQPTLGQAYWVVDSKTCPGI